MIFYISVILGIWADESDNEDAERPSFQARKLQKNYSAPIDFVAGGIHQEGKKNKNKNTEIKKEAYSDDEKPSTSFKTRDSSEESEDDQPRAGMQKEIWFILIFMIKSIRSILFSIN